MHFHTVINEIFRASYTKSRVVRANGRVSTIYFRGLCEYFGRSWQWKVRAENVTEGVCNYATNCLQFYRDGKMREWLLGFHLAGKCCTLPCARVVLRENLKETDDHFRIRSDVVSVVSKK